MCAHDASSPLTAGGLRRNLVVLSFFFCAASVVANQACTDCHSGQDRKAHAVKLAPGSAHAKLDCEECHTGAQTPCKKGMRVVQCKTCHSDQTSALGKSSHFGKLEAFLQKDGVEASPAALCLSCHGANVHTLKKSTDSSAPSNRARVSATCLTCHQRDQHAAVHGYSSSVHGRAMAAGKNKAATCTDCHGSHAIDHSHRAASKVARLAIPSTCGTCHPDQKTAYEASAHWTSAKDGFHESPVCTDCHGEHTIRSSQDAASTTHAGNVSKTCAACHASERLNTKFNLMADSVSSYKTSFHGLANELGDLRAANCASCHGHHSVLPSSDSRSTVYPANLEKTCGNCHPGATASLAKQTVHTSIEKPSHWSVAAARTVYFWLIGLTIGGMLFHNLLDLLHKSIVGTPSHRRSLLHPRFTVLERLQHAVLAASFILLAVSGFALRFPDSSIAWFFHGSGGADLRRSVHRGAAVAFLSLAVCHALYLYCTVRGRHQFKALLPARQDLVDARDTLLTFLRLRKPPLELPHYAYMEKAEYWALAWGSLVMTLTGFVMLYVGFSLSAFPLWVVDLARTVHYLEAVLAVLAIVVWHGYWVFLDPETYPMNLTWLLGHPRPLKQSPLSAHTGHPEAPPVLPLPSPSGRRNPVTDVVNQTATAIVRASGRRNALDS
jgi:cytochrome b subunit of formate dehydrogenase